MQNPESLTQRIEFAHTLRGLAALSVLMWHFLGVFWANPSAVGDLLKVSSLELNMPSYFAPLHFSAHLNYGSFGVAVFFLISGFVIPFSLQSLSVRAFLIARCFRIYPVYLISIAISLSVIWIIGALVSNRPFPYDMGHVIAQALLLRGWLWLPSIDGLSWTLEIEVVFYLVVSSMSRYIVGPKASGGGGGAYYLCAHYSSNLYTWRISY